MQPAYLARFGVDLGDAHEAALGSDAYTLMPAARRFDLGNYNFLGCAAAHASMVQLQTYDSHEIEHYVVGLTISWRRASSIWDCRCVVAILGRTWPI